MPYISEYFITRIDIIGGIEYNKGCIIVMARGWLEFVQTSFNINCTNHPLGGDFLYQTFISQEYKLIMHGISQFGNGDQIEIEIR